MILYSYIWCNKLCKQSQVGNCFLIISTTPRFQYKLYVSGYFWIRKFFLADSKISTSTRIRIQIEFAPFGMYPDSL